MDGLITRLLFCSVNNRVIFMKILKSFPVLVLPMCLLRRVDYIYYYYYIIIILLLFVDTVDELVGTTGVSVTAKVKVMSEPMYSVRHMVKEMVIDELDDVCSYK